MSTSLKKKTCLKTELEMRIFTVVIALTASHKLVLDECHKAKNLRPNGSARPSKTGCAVLKLQEKLPRARVLYASATGKLCCTRTKNLPLCKG